MAGGRRVLITRPAAQSAALELLLRRRGAEPRSLPLFEMLSAENEVALRRTLDASRSCKAWLFTSANAAREAARLDHGPWPALYAIGEATAGTLADLGHPGARLPRTGSSSEDLLAHPELQQVDGQRFLVCTGQGGRDLLVTQLRSRGAAVERLELYRRVAIDHPQQAVRAAITGCDAIICTSGEGLERLHVLLPSDLRAAALGCLLVVPSPRVLELASRLGFAKVRAPESTSDESLVECLFHAA